MTLAHLSAAALSLLSVADPAPDYPAKQPDLAWLVRIPRDPARVAADVTGADPFDRGARRVAAFAVIESALGEFSGERVYAKMPPDVQAVRAQYQIARDAEQQAVLGNDWLSRCEDCPPARFRKLVQGYLDPFDPFARTTLARYVGDPLANQWFEVVRKRRAEKGLPVPPSPAPAVAAGAAAPARGAAAEPSRSRANPGNGKSTGWADLMNGDMLYDCAKDAPTPAMGTAFGKDDGIAFLGRNQCGMLGKAWTGGFRCRNGGPQIQCE